MRIFLLEERLGKAQLPPAAQPRTHSPYQRRYSYSISSAADTATVGDQEKKVDIELSIVYKLNYKANGL